MKVLTQKIKSLYRSFTTLSKCLFSENSFQVLRGGVHIKVCLFLLIVFVEVMEVSIEKKQRRPSFKLRSESLNTVRLRRIFEAFDRNGDGEITVEELLEALHKLGLQVGFKELHLTVADYIPPGQSALDFQSFSELHGALGERLFEGGDVPDEEQELMEAFRVFDEDGDGFISASELRGVLSRLGLLRGHEHEVDRMISGVDCNSDGLVDFSEFKHLMSHGLVGLPVLS